MLFSIMSILTWAYGWSYLYDYIHIPSNTFYMVLITTFLNNHHGAFRAPQGLGSWVSYMLLITINRTLTNMPLNQLFFCLFVFCFVFSAFSCCFIKYFSVHKVWLLFKEKNNNRLVENLFDLKYILLFSL